MSKLSPPVIYYHSVAPKLFDRWVLRFLTLEMSTFEDQMAYLREHGFRAVFFEEWLAFRSGAQRVSGKEICIAFDDGLLDNWVYAYPIAKKYGLRFTLFVSPECIDPRDTVRPTLEDVWAGRCREKDLSGLGYLNWAELRLMQASGVVDVQSHTMSHTKYPVSPRIDCFYYGGYRGMYPIWNARPADKARYFEDAAFEQRLPLGTPLFEEKSAVVARKHSINPEFFAETAALADRFDLSIPEHRPAYEAEARAVHTRYALAGSLVTGIESEDEFQARLRYEIVDSKTIIEEKLQKPVRILCWPHGDNSPEAHALAKASGYLATTAGKLTELAGEPDRIPRIGTSWSLGPWLNRQKFHYKLSSHYHKQPYYSFWLANEFKNKILKRS